MPFFAEDSLRARTTSCLMSGRPSDPAACDPGHRRRERLRQEVGWCGSENPNLFWGVVKVSRFHELFVCSHSISSPDAAPLPWKTYLGKRLLLVVAMLASLSWVGRAHAAAPDNPIFIGSQAIVVSFSANAEDRQLLRVLPTTEIREELANYLSARFGDEELKISAIDMADFLAPPADVLPQNVIWAFVRVDLTTVRLGSESAVVGVVSILLQRETEGSIEALLSDKPMTFFLSEGVDGDLKTMTSKAARDQLERSIIAPLLSFTR